ncbi:hypothetical protein C8R45DRAFT_1039282 [Mycena sanguinolenta]|nr:hypothetical protein C8R45DRAFT_1039282 [Mycena sanguinolenta]
MTGWSSALRRWCFPLVVMLPLCNGGIVCHSADTVGNTLTSSGPGSNGLFVCAYTSGVCSYSSVTGGLDRAASTSPTCEILMDVSDWRPLHARD